VKIEYQIQSQIVSQQFKADAYVPWHRMEPDFLCLVER
jgi:hypothetical protein